MSNQSIPGKLTQAQYWQAHASAQQLAAEGSGFEAALAAVFFKADLHNAAALVAAFPQLFTIEAAPIQFVVKAIYQDDPRAFANTIGRFDTEEAAKAAAAQFEDQEDAPNFMSCDIAQEAAQ